MPVYLDYNATTPVLPEVLDAMLPYLSQTVGNPSSVHRYGRMSRDAIEQARAQVASLVNVEPSQVVFTSGGTESNNLAVKGACARLQPGRLAVSAIEHMSLLEPARAMTTQGWQLDEVAVDHEGAVIEAALNAALKSDTRLVSIMAANNETGAIQDINNLGQIIRSHGAWFHTDASQAAGKIPVDFAACGAHLMTLSAHKLYGPRGIGALIVDKRIEIEPLIHGGGQEKNMRGGTENIAGIVGFGQAAEMAKVQLEERRQYIEPLRDRLESGLIQWSSLSIFSQHVLRLPNTSMFAVAGIEGETLLMQLDRKGYAVSSGSACTSNKTEASHVLKAMGVDDNIGIAAIRVSLGINTTQADVDGFLLAFSEIVNKMLPGFAGVAHV